MKTSTFQRSHGFTLIELLVVITIIMVLAGASFAIIPMMMNKAKTLTSNATASAVEGAVIGYYNEYGSLPDVGYKVTTNTGDGIRFLNIMLGLEGDSNKVQNTRGLKLLTVKETKTRSNGLLFKTSGRSAEGLYDAWGQPFTVVFDIQYDERLRFPLGSKTITLNARRCAVYSPGADKKLGTADDIKSW